MGSPGDPPQANEAPAHRVRVDGFFMDEAEVTNKQFAEFIKATGFVTEAEKKPDWELMKKQLPEGTPKPPDDVLVPGLLSSRHPPSRFLSTMSPVGGDGCQARIGGTPKARQAIFKDERIIPSCMSVSTTPAPMRNGLANDFRPKRNGNTPPAGDLPASDSPGETNILAKSKVAGQTSGKEPSQQEHQARRL